MVDEQAAANAEERDRLRAEIESFVSAVSHDLQQPIRHVRSFAEILQRHSGKQLDAEGADLLARVVRGSVEAQQRLDGLVRLARISTRGKPFAPADCGALLAAAEGRLSDEIAASGAGIERTPLPVLTADAGQLEDVFAHLIANAIKFRQKDQPPRIEIRAEDRGDEWMFSVRDNGIGIDPRHHARIFVVFHRLHTPTEYPGMGLGLAFCKAIVERHGGRLWVESEAGRGSTFRFTIPKALGAESEAPEARSTPQQPSTIGTGAGARQTA